MSDEEMETITHERRTREKQKRRTPDEIWKAHVDQSFKPVDSIKCVKFKEMSEMERSEQKANAPERSTTDPTGAVLEVGDGRRRKKRNSEPSIRPSSLA